MLFVELSVTHFIQSEDEIFFCMSNNFEGKNNSAFIRNKGKKRDLLGREMGREIRYINRDAGAVESVVLATCRGILLSEWNFWILILRESSLHF